ncbi:hypothetical protein HS7_17180 [Sulfolobales archaeon HS-7]|nr:hypothetical protein HS7_17180 [Sulfolobales archaeon HS-7]
MTSDGEYFPQREALRERGLWKVQHLHGELSKKVFVSKNWFKAKVKLSKAYEHLKEPKRDLRWGNT